MDDDPKGPRGSRRSVRHFLVLRPSSSDERVGSDDEGSIRRVRSEGCSMVGFESTGGEGDDGGTSEEGLEEGWRRRTVVRDTLLDGFVDGSACEDVVKERDIVD